MYRLLKPILFKLSPEKAHDVMMNTLAVCSKISLCKKTINTFYGSKIPDLPVSLMGLSFKHPVGLAAGLDKDARAFQAFSALGFSSVEMGTVTPLPQTGNPKPRMFRLEQDRAIINRMGFNSGGLENFLSNFQPHDQATNNSPLSSIPTIAGINIGKNKVTSNENATEDYLKALRSVYSKADYITVNISSPNTESLRELQGEEPLTQLLKALSEERDKLAIEQSIRKPIALKIAPDLNKAEIKVIADLVITYNFDALIAANTTVARPSTLQNAHKIEVGGLSGAVLKQASTEVIAEFYSHLKGKVPIIGVGGIETANDAWQKMLAGADYVQIYSGLIYHGPAMIRDIVTGLQSITSDYNSVAEALAAERP